eukprot:6482507-Amphidinium_carterae.2
MLRFQSTRDGAFAVNMHIQDSRTIRLSQHNRKRHVLSITRRLVRARSKWHRSIVYLMHIAIFRERDHRPSCTPALYVKRQKG